MVKISQACGKNKEKNVLWSEKDNFTFLSVIKAFQAKNGYSTAFPWIALLDEFKKKTGKEVTVKAGKNKFNYLKKKWSSWNYLRHKVTGARWDQETGLITADDAWWELQKAEEFYQFRKKEPSLEVSDLWDDVFGQIVATGKNVVSPSMDLVSTPATDDEVVELDDEVNSGDSLDRQLENDALLDNSQEDILTPGFLEQNMPTRKSKTTTPDFVIKRRRKQTPTSLAYQENMALVGETSRQMLSIMKGHSGISSESTPGFVEAFKELTRIVEVGKMERQSGVWCYAATELGKEQRRQTFMIMKDDGDKIAWLTHEYEMMLKKLPK